MAQWWTYRPEDMLLFSPRVYWRMFELHNAALWPLQAGMLVAGLAMIVLAVRRPAVHGRWIALVLAVIWAFVGWSFVWSRYAAINWAVAYLVPLFALQSVLLALVALLPGGVACGRRDFACWIGLALAGMALILYPLLPWLSGAPSSQAEIFGLAPDPTAIGTMGLLLLAQGRWLPLLFIVPLCWCLVTALTLWTLGTPQAWLPTGAIGSVLASGAWAALRRRR
ncbi:MAG: DUF6064 family protein [Phyllobacterium sp.]